MVAPTLSALLAFYKVARVTKFALPLRTMEGRVAVGPSSSGVVPKFSHKMQLTMSKFKLTIKEERCKKLKAHLMFSFKSPS